MSYALLNLVNNIIGLYIFIIFLMVVFSWLQAFNIVNTRNAFVSQIVRALHALTEPVLRPIRNILPSMGGLDLSPIILLFGLYFLRDFINSAARGALL